MDNELSHYGTKGMRWGKATSRLIKRPTLFKTKRTKTSEYEYVSSLKEKGIKNLTNDQINTVIKRMNLEKQYRDVNPSKFKKGEEMAKNVLAIGTTIAAIYALSKTPLGEAIKNKLRRAS